MLRTLLCPTIEDVVFRVAVEYENLSRGKLSKQDWRTIPSSQRGIRIAKSGVNYVKRGEKDLTLYLVLTPYIMQVNGEHYLFGGVPIGRNFRVEGNQISFSGAPRILRQEHYHHPFVKDNNEVCYTGDDTRWTKPPIGVIWNRWYDVSVQETMRKIALWLREGKNALQKGYFGSVVPVHSLSKDNFPSEYQTPHDAQRSGMSIILNGNHHNSYC